MLKTKDTNQLKFEAFKTPFEIKMNRNNRWVRLSEILPWEELIGISEVVNKNETKNYFN